MPLRLSFAFHYAHGTLGRFHLAFVLLARDHAFEQTVFGLRDLGFGVLDFVLKGLVGFVGLYFKALVPVFARLFLPGIHIHFVLLAVFEACGERFLGGGDPLTGVANPRIHSGKLRGDGLQAVAQFRQTRV